jgi:hypothetical protein
MYASPSLLAPFSGLTLVWVIVFSKSLTNESATLNQMLAAGLIVIGEIVVTLSGDHTSSDRLTVASFYEVYGNQSIVTYQCMMIGVMCIIFLGIQRGSPMVSKLAFGASGGTISGMLLYVKDATSMVQTEGFANVEIWILISLASFVAISGLILLTACMKRYDATYTASMFICSFVFSASIMSIIRFDTIANIESNWSLAFYCLGLLILLMGIVILVAETGDGSGKCLVRSGGCCWRSAENPLLGVGMIELMEHVDAGDDDDDNDEEAADSRQ